jgi:integrase/recombinase XerD
MTFFDSFYTMPSVRNRHNSAPLFTERVRYLSRLIEERRSGSMLRQVSSHLLQVNRALGFSEQLRSVSIQELEATAREWETYSGPLRNRLPTDMTYELFMRVARGWLRFNDCLEIPRKTRLSESRLREFEDHLRNKVGLAATTIETRTRHTSYFLIWMNTHRVRLCDVTIQHVERYLKSKQQSGWSLETKILGAYCLRMFFRFAEERGWTSLGLRHAVPKYARLKHRFVKKGPKWSDVRRMLSSLKGVSKLEKRDRAMVFLMAVYGLRSGEVRDLRCSDVQLQSGVLTVQRGKNLQAQRFPLQRNVAVALKAYLAIRPVCESPFLFVRLLSPHHSLCRGSVYDAAHKTFAKNEIVSVRKGPHGFRHACADRLMQRGASAYEIAAFLGHKDLASVQTYTRFDIKTLRPIASLSLKGLL